jgi:hypothetical protein
MNVSKFPQSTWLVPASPHNPNRSATADRNPAASVTLAKIVTDQILWSCDIRVRSVRVTSAMPLSSSSVFGGAPLFARCALRWETLVPVRHFLRARLPTGLMNKTIRLRALLHSLPPGRQLGWASSDATRGQMPPAYTPSDHGRFPFQSSPTRRIVVPGMRLSGANARQLGEWQHGAHHRFEASIRTRAARSTSWARSDSTEVLVTAGRFGGRQCARLARRSESQISTLLPSNWIQPR